MELNGYKSAAGTSSGGKDTPTNLYHVNSDGNFITSSGQVLGFIFDSVALENPVSEQGNVAISKFEVIPETGILTAYKGSKVFGYVIDIEENETNVDAWVLETIHRRGQDYTYVVTGTSEAPGAQGDIRGEVPVAKKYVVKPRDTLMKIAQEQLYDARRWREIHAINETVIGLDPAGITVGMVLKVPRK